jgi:hypothetical protein
MLMLREAVRVARQGIVVKDHLREGFLAGATLRFMDWVGNAGWGVALPYNYWNAVQWRHAREQLHIEIDKELTALGLYPWWANWWFGRSLHFIARFRVPFGEHGRFKPSATRVES